MIPIIIGISSGILVILTIHFLKFFDKTIIYGLILTAIGFIYVGFSWSSIPDLIIAIIQAMFFIIIAYFGIQKNLYILASGYFLHGLWDIAYSYIHYSTVIPPHYDLFCLSIDFIMGIYLIFLKIKQPVQGKEIYYL